MVAWAQILPAIASMVTSSRSADGDTGLAAVIKVPSVRKTSADRSTAFSGGDLLRGELGGAGKVTFTKKPTLIMWIMGIGLCWYIYKEL